MAGSGGRMNSALSTVFPEKRVFIQSGNSTRYIRISPLSQLGFGALSLATAGWLAIATGTVVMDRVGASDAPDQRVVLHEAYQSRLEELSAERDLRAAKSRSAQNRFQIAMGQIGRQQSEILAALEERRELETALDLMRGRLQEAVAQRDALGEINDRLTTRMSAVNETLSEKGRSRDDLDETLRTLTAALTDTVEVRDAAAAEREELERRVAELELQSTLQSQAHAEMVADLEEAVSISFGALEEVFSRAELKPENLIAGLRDQYSGQGGPAEAVVSSRSYVDPALDTRLDRLMLDLDRMNLLRVAIGKIPFAHPVKASHRFTSGFGVRRDPKGGGRRMHSGMDFAAPRGTPIYATADGVVVSADREGGYGLTVRIRHDFGFETVYAHQSKINVRKGQRISRGEHIGDMGSTGRSTGVHLHYEVHLNGRPVNPKAYMEAVKDVF